jgi:hypothetical protein
MVMVFSLSSRSPQATAIDRLVHHATIIEMNVESYRRRAAIERKRGSGRPATRTTIKANAD